MKPLKTSELVVGEVYLIGRTITGASDKKWQPAVFEGFLREPNTIDQLKFKFLIDGKNVLRWSSEEVHVLSLAWINAEIERREADISKLQDEVLKLYRLKAAA